MTCIGNCPIHGPMFRPPCGLDALPLPWLQQLLSLLCSAESKNQGDLLPLFRTSRTFRDLILAHHELMVGLWCALSQEEADSSVSKLLLACKHSANVRLSLNARFWSTHESRTVTAERLMLNTVAASGHTLNAITSMHIQVRDAALEGLVPQWIASTCPNLKHLELFQCVIGCLPGTTDAITTCWHLTSLTLCQTQLPQSHQFTPCQWHRQLQALPHLSSVTGQIAASLEGFSVVGSQLRQLIVHDQQPAIHLHHIATWFSHLTHLDVCQMAVDDAGMDALMEIRSLRRLGCRAFNLKDSYTHRHCPWTDVSVLQLDIAVTDLLPWNSTARHPAQLAQPATVQLNLVAEKCDTPSLDAVIRPSPDLPTAHKAARAAHSGAIHIQSPYTHIFNATADSACLAALMPMLSTAVSKGQLRTLYLWHAAPVNVELLTAVGKCLQGLVQLGFHHCTFDPGAWPVLLAALPATLQHISFNCCVIAESDLTQMVAADGVPDGHSQNQSQSMIVRLSAVCVSAWEHDWLPRVKAMSVNKNLRLCVSF